MIRILVTGGTGLIGKALDKIISEEKPTDEKWFFVGSRDADLTDPANTNELFTRIKPTCIIHLAAVVGGLYRKMNYHAEMENTNLQINSLVLNASLEHDCMKTISVISDCIFPDYNDLPLDESQVVEWGPNNMNMRCSYAQRFIDMFNITYGNATGDFYTSVISCNVFGPHDNFNLEEGHAIPGMINRMHKLKNEKSDVDECDRVFKVYGSGMAKRQYIYSIDLAKLLLWALRHYEELSPIILCVDESQEMTMIEVATSIAKAFDFKGKIGCDWNKPDGEMQKTMSNAKLRKYLPDFKFTNFDAAINETVKWYIRNYDTARK